MSQSWLLAVLLLSGNALADGRVDQIRARGRLIVSVKNDAKRPHKDPAHFQKRGFEVELTRAIARRLLGDESKVELRILARPVRLPMLGVGAVDMVVSMIPVNAETSAQYDLSHPYFAAGLGLMAREDARVDGIADVAGKTVAVLKQGFNDYGRELRRVAEGRGIALMTRYYPTFEAAANAVSAGEAAAMVSNVVDVDAFMRDHRGYRVAPRVVESREYAVAVRKGDADLLRVVNATIDELRKSGELKRMIAKWRLPYLLSAG
jgi:aspartate/glutamate/glutamine transport system substrate-binding protein